MPAGKERDESKGGLRETGWKIRDQGNLVRFGLWYWEEGGRADDGYPFSLVVVDFQEEMLGCIGWWGRGQLLRKSEAAHITLCGRSDVEARGVCHHHHLGP